MAGTLRCSLAKDFIGVMRALQVRLQNGEGVEVKAANLKPFVSYFEGSCFS